MLITVDALKKYNMNIKGIIHIGAHIAEETTIYNQLLVNNVIWIEANPIVYNQAKKVTDKYPTYKILNNLISDTDNDDVHFYVANDSQCSSMLKFKKHLEFAPQLFTQQDVLMKSTRLDTLIDSNNIDINNYNFMNIDIQGTELRALKGLGKYINNIDYIYTEVNTAEIYENCALMSEIDTYLSEYGFSRVDTALTENNWGDALYIKNYSVPTTDKYSIASLISYCTNDFKFLKPCIESVKPFSKEIIVVACDHYFNGEPENEELLEKSRKLCENMNVKFVVFEYDEPYFKSLNMQRLTDPFKQNRHFIPVETDDPWFWHQVNRLYAFNAVTNSEFVLFIDVDEIFESNRFMAWLERFDYKNYSSMKFDCYWYFRESKFRALQTEDWNALTLVKRNTLFDEHFFLHDSERHNFFTFPIGNKAAKIVGTDGKPMVHHYSWVRTKDEMIKKTRTWGHAADKNWAELIDIEFSRDFDHRTDKDFVHGYDFNTVQPLYVFDEDDICITARFDVINYLVKNYNLKNYLEIGIANGDSHNAVNAILKDSVDPAANVNVKYKMTSDAFFKEIAPTLGYKYDIIFVDGLHEDAQVMRDISNSLAYLNDTGFIVVHDCLPVYEDEQIVPYNHKLGWWLGDGWKAFMKYRMTRSDLSMCVVTVDLGCGIIQKGFQETYDYTENPLEWKYYATHKKEMMNVITIDEFKRKFNNI